MGTNIQAEVAVISVFSLSNLACGGFDDCTLALPLWIQINIGPIFFLVIGIYVQQLPLKQTQKKYLNALNMVQSVYVVSIREI